MVGGGWLVRQRGAQYAPLPKLHGRKRAEQALLCRVWVAAALAMPSLRLRERAHREVLWRLRKARRGDRASGSRRPLAPTVPNAASSQ